jgi:membrane protein
VSSALERLRARAPWLDHVVRAGQRYNEARGNFYAAGITYFTIFALFPLLMVGFATVGFILASRPQLLSEIDTRVKSAIPEAFATLVTGLMDSAIASRASVGAIGLATALWAGLSWMSNLRTALTEMWQQPEEEIGYVRKKASDLLALVSTFLATLLTIGLSALSDPALRLTGSLRAMSLVLSLLVAWLMFTWIIAKLPRHPVPLRVAMRAGLLAAVGFEIFKQLAAVYLKVVLHGPAGAIFGPVFGLMLFAYITARLVLFAAAWAATGPAPAG